MAPEDYRKEFLSTHPAVSARCNKPSRYSKQVIETTSRFAKSGRRTGRVRQAQAKAQEENEDLLRNLSEIRFPSVPQKTKLFSPVFVAFRRFFA